MSAAKGFLDILGYGAKAVGVLGSVGTAATVVETVAKRTGHMDPKTSLVGETVGFVLDIAGAPDAGKQKVLAKLGAAPAPATAPVATSPAIGETSDVRTVCPQCYFDKPIALGEAGEKSLSLVQCDEHRDLSLGVADYFARMSEGYVQSLGQVELGETCPPKPDIKDFIGPHGLRQSEFQASQIAWNACVQRAAAAQAKADKKQADAVAAQAAKDEKTKKHLAAQKDKIARMLLDKQAKAYENKLADLKAQQQTATDAAKQADIQKQIDTLTAAKAESDKMAAALQEQVRNAQHKAEIDALTAKINEAGSKPGGMDQMLMTILMSQLQRPAYADPYAAPMAQPPIADPYAAMPPGLPWSPPGEFAPADDAYGYEFEGGPDAALAPDLAEAFGLDGAPTNADGSIALALLNGGHDDILADLAGETMPAISGCNVFACSR